MKNLFTKKNAKKNSNKSSSNQRDFLEVIVHFVYRYIGRKLLLKKGFREFFEKNIYNQRYEKILRESNLKILPEEYFVSIFILLFSSIILVILFSIVFLTQNFFVSTFIFYVGILFIVGLGFSLYNYPVYLSQKRKKEIDASIPYLLPYMKILAKELSLAKIIEIIDDFLIYKEIREEFKKINHYSTFLGYDINTSIREAMSSCPSRQLADMMNDMVTISNSGGNIYHYLDRKLNNLNEEIEAIEKKNIDTLLIYSQIYVVMLLIAPLFFAIMSSILNMIGEASQISAGGGDVTDTVVLLVLLLMVLPVVYAGFMMLVYYSKPLYSRLKPIEK